MNLLRASNLLPGLLTLCLLLAGCGKLRKLAMGDPARDAPAAPLSAPATPTPRLHPKPTVPHPPKKHH
jgi:hypothetical protein